MSVCDHSKQARELQRRRQRRSIATMFAVREKDDSFGAPLSRKALKRFAPDIYAKNKKKIEAAR